MAQELIQYEKPKPESTCRVVLEDDDPCKYPRFLFALCHAWYATRSRPQTTSMRQIFVEGLQEAKAIWNHQCPIEAKEISTGKRKLPVKLGELPISPEWGLPEVG